MMWRNCNLERDICVASFPKGERCQATEQSLEISGGWGIGWAILKDDWTLPWWQEGTFLITCRSCCNELRAYLQLVRMAVPGNRAGAYTGNEQIATICDSTPLVCCIMWEAGLDSPEVCFHLQRDKGVQPKRNMLVCKTNLNLALGLCSNYVTFKCNEAKRSLPLTCWPSKGNFHQHLREGDW